MVVRATHCIFRARMFPAGAFRSRNTPRRLTAHKIIQRKRERQQRGGSSTVGWFASLSFNNFLLRSTSRASAEIPRASTRDRHVPGRLHAPPVAVLCTFKILALRRIFLHVVHHFSRGHWLTTLAVVCSIWDLTKRLPHFAQHLCIRKPRLWASALNSVYRCGDERASLNGRDQSHSRDTRMQTYEKVVNRASVSEPKPPGRVVADSLVFGESTLKPCVRSCWRDHSKSHQRGQPRSCHFRPPA